MNTVTKTIKTNSNIINLQTAVTELLNLAINSVPFCTRCIENDYNKVEEQLNAKAELIMDKHNLNGLVRMQLDKLLEPVDGKNIIVSKLFSAYREELNATDIVTFSKTTKALEITFN